MLHDTRTSDRTTFFEVDNSFYWNFKDIFHGNKNSKFILNTSHYTAKTVVTLAFSESPQAYLGDIWEVVHDEVRVHLPGANELMDVLVYMGLKPEMELLETLSPHNYHSHSDALQDIRNRLYVNANSEKDVLLKDSLTRMLNGVVSSDGDVYELKGSVNRALCLIRWDFS